MRAQCCQINFPEIHRTFPKLHRKLHRKKSFGTKLHNARLKLHIQLFYCINRLFSGRICPILSTFVLLSWFVLVLSDFFCWRTNFVKKISANIIFWASFLFRKVKNKALDHNLCSKIWHQNYTKLAKIWEKLHCVICSQKLHIRRLKLHCFV